MITISPLLRPLVLVSALVLCTPVSYAAETAPAPSYADLADLADAGDLVVHAKIRKAIALAPERSGGLASGHARVYVEADTVSLIAGNAPLGRSLKYLVDVPLDAKGKLPKLKKREVLLFARPVPGKPEELQLVGPSAQVDWDPALEARLRPILAELASVDAAPAITGVRDALSVAGSLVGESETQIFLSTKSGDPVSLTVVRRPGMAPVWGVSFGEIVDQAARPPAGNTLAWYRLACFLPDQLPSAANLAQDSVSRARAAHDYRFIIEQLGACPRTLARQ